MIGFLAGLGEGVVDICSLTAVFLSAIIKISPCAAIIYTVEEISARRAIGVDSEVYVGPIRGPAAAVIVREASAYCSEAAVMFKTLGIPIMIEAEYNSQRGRCMSDHCYDQRYSDRDSCDEPARTTSTSTVCPSSPAIAVQE